MVKVQMSGILKEIKDTKNPIIKMLVFENKGKVETANAFLKGMVLPKLPLDRNYRYSITVNGNFNNLGKTYNKDKVATGWDIEELGEDVCQPAPMGTTGKVPSPSTPTPPTNNWQEQKELKIIRQSCMRSAAMIVATQKTTDINEATNATLDMTKAFEKYCNTGE